MDRRIIEHIGLFVAAVVCLWMGVDWIFTGEPVTPYDAISSLTAAILFRANYQIKRLYDRIYIFEIEQELIDRPGQTAAQVSEATGIMIATTYILMLELERRGRITSLWKDMPYPRRRLYYAVTST